MQGKKWTLFTPQFVKNIDISHSNFRFEQILHIHMGFIVYQSEDADNRGQRRQGLRYDGSKLIKMKIYDRNVLILDTMSGKQVNTKYHSWDMSYGHFYVGNYMKKR